MPIPDYQSLMLPVLRAAVDSEEHRFRDVVTLLAEQFHLTEAERSACVPSGTMCLFDNRVSWAKAYLKQVGALESRRWGYFNITERGKRLLAANPLRIDNTTLGQYPEFSGFLRRQGRNASGADRAVEPSDVRDTVPGTTSDRSFVRSYERLLAAELLAQVKASTASLFEKTVIDLLKAMGYRALPAEGTLLAGHCDGADVAGTFAVNESGRHLAYVHVTRDEAPVQRKEIELFADALSGHQARAGLFITTSTFSDDARARADLMATNVTLVDGTLLARLMIGHNVGVSVVAGLAIKKFDPAYFGRGNP